MMLARACTVIGIGAILIAAPVWGAAGRYDPAYPFCIEAPDTGGTRIECSYTSIEQCRIAATPGNCFKNPYYVPRPTEAAPAAPEPATNLKKNAGRYDPDYPVCMEAIEAGGGGAHFECRYTSIEQCRKATLGLGGTCSKNPYYVPRPTEAAPAEAEPEPATDLKKNAGRYGTDYPVCMEATDVGGGTHFECSYTSFEQCRQSAVGTPGTCFSNPSYVPPPPAPASAQTEPAPPAKPTKPTKPAKSAKSANSPPLSPQPAQSR